MLGSTEDTYTQSTGDNTFLYLVIEYSLAKGTAMSSIKKYSKSKDGFLTGKDVVKWYEDQDFSAAIT